MRTTGTCGAAAVVVWCGFCAQVFATPAADSASGPLRVYKVGKTVAEFPKAEDLTTPESAYATFNRAVSSDKPDWLRLSARSIRDRVGRDFKQPKMSPDEAARWHKRRVLEVRIFRGRYAAVIARRPGTSEASPIDCRSFELEDGRWLNLGHGYYRNVEAARQKFAGGCGRYAPEHTRPPVDDPEAYLKPFVDFLKTKGQAPKPFVMKALAGHKVVIMGEIHHRPRYWAFNASLVSDPEFPKTTGVIYLELPSNDQGLIDTFLASEKLDTMPVIETLRDIFEMGWPDKPMLDFFVAVWKANQHLPTDRRLRIVLVDMQRPWKKIHKRADWQAYDVDRDRYMADNVVRDVREHAGDKRNTLLFVGATHAMLDFKCADRTTPIKSAGWHLRKALGADAVFAIMQHMPVMTNMGRVDGRLCMGLFASAFAKLGNKPIALPLDTGPFGQESFDGFPDRRPWGQFRDGYDAYLYLGPLEDEVFSPLIPGFYTDEHLKEINRRYRLMYGKGWDQAYRRRLTVKNFEDWMGSSWGRPRTTWSRQVLGPIDAWHHGGRDWKEAVRDQKHKEVLENKQAVARLAKRLFGAIRSADYTRDYSHDRAWGRFLPPDCHYRVHTDYPGWVAWICRTFKDNPIRSVVLGQVFVDKDGRPAVPYMLGLKDGTILRGNLPFEYEATSRIWLGVQGLDWHLK